MLSSPSPPYMVGFHIHVGLTFCHSIVIWPQANYLASAFLCIKWKRRRESTSKCCPSTWNVLFPENSPKWLSHLLQVFVPMFPSTWGFPSLSHLKLLPSTSNFFLFSFLYSIYTIYVFIHFPSPHHQEPECKYQGFCLSIHCHIPSTRYA